MKTAICAISNELSSTIDPRFGRCSYFAIYDNETNDITFVPNTSKDALEGAGPEAAKNLASMNVKMVISGEFGGKVKAIFDKLQIRMVVIPDSTKTIDTIITNLKLNN